MDTELATDPEIIYDLAYECHRRGVYKDASRYFRLLTYIDPLSKRYWMALGASLQEGELYQDATYAYAMSSFIDDQDPLPHFYVAGSYFSLEEPNEAFKALREAAIRVSNAPKPEALKSHIRAIHKAWKKPGE